MGVKGKDTFLSKVQSINRHYLKGFDSIESIIDPVDFSSFFFSLVQFIPLQNNDNETRSLAQKSEALLCLHHIFQNLEVNWIREECFKITSIAIWNHILESKRSMLLNEYERLGKLWKHTEKKFKKAGKAEQERLILERNFLSCLIKDLLDTLHSLNVTENEKIKHCEFIVDFFIYLESNFATRRYVNTLLKDSQLVVLVELSPLFKHPEGELFAKLWENLRKYISFPVNEFTAVPYTDLEQSSYQYSKLTQLQELAYEHFREDLKEVSLANFTELTEPKFLYNHLSILSLPQLKQLCQMLYLKTFDNIVAHPPTLDEKEYLLLIISNYYKKKENALQEMNRQALFPTEEGLFSEELLKTHHYNGERPLPIPRLNLQFLTIRDYLSRCFYLYQQESCYAIRKDIEDAVQRLAPKINWTEGITQFTGWSRMANLIRSFTITEVAKPRIGEESPARVVADLTYSLSDYSRPIQKEWDSLRPKEVLFLLTIEATVEGSKEYKGDIPFRSHYGLKYVRACEILDTANLESTGIDAGRVKPRTLKVLLDPRQYRNDMDQYHSKSLEDVYQTFNVVLRRKSKANNFKAVLETVQYLLNEGGMPPEWFNDVLLGFGDPAALHYSKLEDRNTKLHFRDTFLDIEHLTNVFPNQKVIHQIPHNDVHIDLQFNSSLGDNEAAPVSKASKHKKRKTDTSGPEELKGDENTILATVADSTNTTIFAHLKRRNHIRFNASQVEAIRAGMSHGLTLVVGPPGTGKTDVAVQIISNLYHSHPKERILFIAHSNQAVNQLFEKVIALDVNQIHILRLGHGEEELDSDHNYGKVGRVNSLMEKRHDLLVEVEKLALSLKAPSDFAYSCETAGYFFLHEICSRWEAFLENNNESSFSSNEFPFLEYFSSFTEELFPEDKSNAECISIAKQCFNYLSDMFSQLKEMRVYELLQNNRDRSNYLLSREARITAMTCMHAALKFKEMCEFDFKYDTLIIEESAQILEVESYIPLVMQKGENRNILKRIVMIGDHHQLPPVVSNYGLQKYANLQQSMFSRLVRMGTPTIQLSEQGRSRPSIADLYRWRYRDLGDLPLVKERAEFKVANPGFLHEYQLINVGDYQGHGESEPLPFYYQNVGEAEYVVSVFQFMRLLGYPAERITILTTYNGQKHLIRDVLKSRCSWHSMFGEPKTITTVDKYQGQQNDYILLSLVRTKSAGHLRDIRRLGVALSRARLGLYIFCRQELFECIPELSPAFHLLQQRENALMIVKGEAWGSTERVIASETSSKSKSKAPTALRIKDVLEMGKLVHVMSQEMVQSLLQRQQELEEEGSPEGEEEDQDMQEASSETEEPRDSESAENMEEA